MRVDFYILSATSENERLKFACRLTEKAYSLDNTVYAHTASPAEAEQLDAMLWTFRDGSFVPHQLLTTDAERRAPVSVGSGNQHESTGDLLINLASAPPAFAGGFGRIAEIVAGDETSRQAGRERFKYYRDMGVTPETHQIG